jgi:hypothetical protein
MAERVYRLKTAMVAIVDHDGKKTLLTIPVGGTVEVSEEHIEGNGLTDVKWEGTTVRIFKTDLRHRAEPLDGRRLREGEKLSTPGNRFKSSPRIGSRAREDFLSLLRAGETKLRPIPDRLK